MAFDELIESVLAYIENHLDETLTLEELAIQFNVSKFYFHRIFSAVMGESLNQYCLSRRMNAAVKLLTASKLSLTEIAYDLNFSSQSVFTRTFKKWFGISPIHIRKGLYNITVTDIPSVAKRPFKNINGDLVSEFTIDEIQPTFVKGVVFSVDLALDDYKDKIRSQVERLMNSLKINWNGPFYMIYSNCQPDSTQFNVIFGLPLSFETELENVYPAEFPRLLCAKLRYAGDLLEIGNLFKMDAVKFLKVAKMEAAEHHIELIQVFESLSDLYENYEIWLPIIRLTDELVSV